MCDNEYLLRLGLERLRIVFENILAWFPKNQYNCTLSIH